MGDNGFYLDRWNLDFKPENGTPLAVPVQVKLPYIPLHCWDEETLRNIRNALGKYIDIAKVRESMYACERIYVEVVQLFLDSCSFIQPINYDQIPFKCQF